MKGGPAHLARRAAGSLSNRPVNAVDEQTARGLLNQGEFRLWQQMQPRDQRHSLHVLTRFDSLLPGAGTPERAAALLHDVGKIASSAGWLARVVATVLGPRTRRLADYLDHESIGAAMLEGVSDPVTVSLVSGAADSPAADALRRADAV